MENQVGGEKVIILIICKSFDSCNELKKISGAHRME
jgi:hypothetical protein